MGRLSILSTAVLAWLSFSLQVALAASTIGARVLVVHEQSFDRTEYSTYLTSLEAQGLQLTYRSVKESTPSLYEYEDAAFDHLLLFAPTAKCK